VDSLSRTEYASDALIVGGDVSDDCLILGATLRAFKERFAEASRPVASRSVTACSRAHAAAILTPRQVFFTPGNHELWTERRASTPAPDAVAKLDAVLALCDSLGVRTQPALVGAAPGATPLWVVPLLSWYHAEFDTEPELDVIAVPPCYAIMADFRACRWPEGVNARSDDVARLLDARNDAEAKAWPAELLSTLAQEPEARQHPVVTFSHFLPRLELCPEKRFLFFPNLPQAVGSTFLGERVAALRPSMHVFGHTHFACDTALDGVRYIQAALAYPEERETRMGTLRIGSLAERDALAPLLLYDAAGAGTWAPRYAARWSQHYDEHPREPGNQTLPPWVEKRYARRIAAAAATKAAAATRQ
jgi:hypothetical protein